MVIEARPSPNHRTEQLLICRYLFLEGVRALDSNPPFAPGLAVSLFQDAAELLLAIVAVHVDAKISPGTNFMSFWELVERAPKNTESLQVPSKAAMLKLNTARVAFKHHGQRILSEDAVRFRVDTEVFLKETTSRFFKEDFDNISLAELIASREVRTKVKEAEGHLTDQRYEDAIVCCAMAEYDVSKSIARWIPTVDWRLERGFGIESEDRSLQAAITHLAQHLGAHRRAILLLLSKTPAEEQARFRSLAPGVLKSINGTAQVTWWKKIPMEGQIAQDAATFCVNYVTRYALRLQEATTWEQNISDAE